MAKPLVIMVSGYLKSGKDVVGKRLCKAHGFTRVAFADLLKQQVSELYNLNRAALDTQVGKDTEVRGRTVRSILIEHGQLRRKQNVNYWVECVLDTLQIQKLKRVVITDWRFPNEYARLAEQAVVHSWRIDRWDAPPLIDETETALDSFPFDVRIDNRGSLADLCEKVDKLAPPTFLLLDVDGVILRWIDGFKQFLRTHGYGVASAYPTRCDMTGWITEPDASLHDLIVSFNRSRGFAALAPYDDALAALKSLKERLPKCTVVAISSCGDETVVVESRKKNIQKHFDGLVDEIVCLPLGSSKAGSLKKYPPSVWVDDIVKNVIEGVSVGHDAVLCCRPWSMPEGGVADHSVPGVDWTEIMRKI